MSSDQAGDPATTYAYTFTTVTRTDASGTYAISLDAYGRQAGLIDPLHPSNPYAWNYAASGALAKVTDPTGNVTTNTYDPLGRLTARATTGAPGCTNCASLSFAYNCASNVVSKVSTISGATTNGTTTLAYDPVGRLTTFTPPASIQTQLYTWNPIPDRASIKTGTAAPITTAFDAASRPTSDSGGGLYTSDHEGRLTGMPGKSAEYDALGRLVTVRSQPSGNIIATYKLLSCQAASG